MSDTEPRVYPHIPADPREKRGIQINWDEVGIGEEWDSEGKQETVGGLWDSQRETINMTIQFFLVRALMANNDGVQPSIIANVPYHPILVVVMDHD